MKPMTVDIYDGIHGEVMVVFGSTGPEYSVCLPKEKAKSLAQALIDIVVFLEEPKRFTRQIRIS